jgi:hypothetical protein
MDVSESAKSWFGELAARCSILNESTVTSDASAAAEDRRRRWRARHAIPQEECRNTFMLHGSYLQEWMCYGSWKFCTGCLSMHKAPLSEKTLQPGRQESRSEECVSCRGPYVIPDWRNIPLPLLQLTPAIIFALRPMNVHLGEKHAGHAQGYLRHRQALRLSWKQQSVEECLAEMSDLERARGEAAFEHLMRDDSSAYRIFIYKHRSWLSVKTTDARWPFRGLAEQFLECALWPHLYLFTSD